MKKYFAIGVDKGNDVLTYYVGQPTVADAIHVLEAEEYENLRILKVLEVEVPEPPKPVVSTIKIKL